MNSIISKDMYQEYFSSLIKGQRIQCHNIVHRLKDDQATLKNIYTQVFQESLYEVGKLWEYNHISVAVEHMATAITEALMNIVYEDLIIPDDTEFRALVSSAENEYHQIGAKMVADIFEMNGWGTWYLGANTPVNDLIQMIDKNDPHAIGISLSVYFHLPELETMIQKIRIKHHSIPIIIGGQAFKHGNGQTFAQQYSDVHYFENLDYLEKYLKEFKK
ncbi:Cobalamin B12-binding domain-containing protein [Candidatus Magnetomorum sp. HK-1]|nr:Cobalamin B12-binding domain-containing protein [Candidatus Magnetomorum sp. HK-1]